MVIWRHLCVSRHFGRRRRACDCHRKLAITIVQDVLRKGCPHIHNVRLESLCDVVRAALSATSHTLSNLGRALEPNVGATGKREGTAVAVHHRVKRVDRLLGSRVLQQERASIYAAIATFWLHDLGFGEPTHMPHILVDWSYLIEHQKPTLRLGAVLQRLPQRNTLGGTGAGGKRDGVRHSTDRTMRDQCTFAVRLAVD